MNIRNRGDRIGKLNLPTDWIPKAKIEWKLLFRTAEKFSYDSISQLKSFLHWKKCMKSIPGMYSRKSKLLSILAVGDPLQYTDRFRESLGLRIATYTFLVVAPTLQIESWIKLSSLPIICMHRTKSPLSGMQCQETMPHITNFPCVSYLYSEYNSNRPDLEFISLFCATLGYLG